MRPRGDILNLDACIAMPQAEALLPEERVFIQRIRRNGKIIEATADIVIQARVSATLPPSRSARAR